LSPQHGSRVFKNPVFAQFIEQSNSVFNAIILSNRFVGSWHTVNEMSIPPHIHQAVDCALWRSPTKEKTLAVSEIKQFVELNLRDISTNCRFEGRVEINGNDRVAHISPYFSRGFSAAP
jgi:hypothetical protein